MNNRWNHNDDMWHYISDNEDDYGDYYDQYDEVPWIGSYHPSFPNEWRESHAEGTGPEQCRNCADYGCYDGQFIGYCANCADYVYNGTRGRGFIDVCTENDSEEVRQWISVFDTYLHAFEHAVIPGAYDEYVAVVSDDEEEEFGGVELVGIDTVFEAHYEGGYVDF